MRMENDRQFFLPEWRRADAAQDPRIDRDVTANLWTHGVPPMDSRGGWPSDDAGAQTMWDEQISDHGCPFFWLLESAGLA